MNTITPQPQPMLGNPQTGQIGLGMAQYLDFQKKETRLEFVEENLNKLKAEHEDLKTCNKALQIKLDEATSKCTLAQDRLAFEVEKVEAKKKPTISDQSVETLMGALPGLMGVFTGAGATQPQEGLGNPHQDLPAAKQTFIEELASNNVTEEQTNFLYNVLQVIKQNPMVMHEITNILTTQ